MIASVVALSLAAVSSASPPQGQEADFPGTEYHLTDDKIAAYRAAALRGEVEPAVALSDYYDLWKNDSHNGEFWGRLAAEHGGCQELRRYQYRFLRFVPYPYLNTPERQRMWLERKDRTCAAESEADAQR
jgi:hypothetical protein